MQVQKIHSQQSYTGKTLFVSQNGHKFTEHVELYFPKEMKAELTELKKIFKRKPYDLFISKDNMFPGFYKIDANEDYVNVTRRINSHSSILVHEQVAKSSLIEAAKDAIEKYEEIIKYKPIGNKGNTKPLK